MQPEAQTTTRGSLAVSAGALEIANVMQGALEGFWFTFTFYHFHKTSKMHLMKVK